MSKSKYAELRPGLHHFRTREIGKTRNPNGSWSRQTVGETFIETKRGLIREDEWAVLALKAVEENNDLSLLKSIEKHVKAHCLWLKEREIRPYALECLMIEAYKAWDMEWEDNDAKESSRQSDRRREEETSGNTGITEDYGQ